MAHTADQFAFSKPKTRQRALDVPRPPAKPTPWPLFVGDCATRWGDQTMLHLLWKDAQRLRDDTDGKP